MLLRRVVEHVKDQNWTAVALDFSIVVLGVFIGIQFSNWNDVRAQRTQEALYQQRLAQDFDLIIDRLEVGLAATRSSVESGQLLLDYIKSSETEIDVPTKEDAAAALGRIGASSVPAGPSATFAEMTATGDLSIIRNEELRDALFEYDLAASSNRDSWRVLRQNIIEEQRTLFAYFHAEFEIGADNLSLRIIGFDEEGFLSDESVPPAISIIGGISINENQLLRQQLGRARQVRDHIGDGEGG